MELREEEDGSWTALVPELPGCVAVGDSPNEAVEDLPQVIDLWIATARERGLPVPAPRREETANGRVLVRLPRTVHAKLLRAAREEGVTLNAYCVSVLSAGLAQALERSHDQPRPAAFFGGGTAVKLIQSKQFRIEYRGSREQEDFAYVLSSGVPTQVEATHVFKGELNKYFGVVPGHDRDTEDEQPSRQSTLALAT